MPLGYFYEAMLDPGRNVSRGKSANNKIMTNIKELTVDHILGFFSHI